MALCIAYIILATAAQKCSMNKDVPRSFYIVSDRDNFVVSNDFPNGKYAVQAHMDNGAATIPGAIWIWDNPDTHRKYWCTFYVNFVILNTPNSAELKISADDKYYVSINGIDAAKTNKKSDWDKVDSHNVLSCLRVGVNKLVIEAYTKKGRGGLIYRLSITTE